MHLLVHPPICKNYSYFRSFLLDIPVTNTSPFYIEQIIPLAFLNTQISQVRVVNKERTLRSNDDVVLYDALLSKQKMREKSISKYINELYKPTALVNEYKKIMLITKKVGMGNIERLCDGVINMSGIVDSCREFLLSEGCPLAFLEKKYGQYLSYKINKAYHPDAMTEENCFEDITMFISANYSREECSAEVYNGRMIYAEIFILLRIGDYSRIQKLLSDFEFFLETTCKGFVELFKEYIKTKKTCQSHNKRAIKDSGNTLTQDPYHKCVGELSSSHMKTAQRMLNDLVNKDQFLVVILHIITEKNTGQFIKTLEDFLWFNMTIKTPENVLKTMFSSYPNRDGKLLFLVLFKLFDDALEHLFTQDFDVCEAYTLMRMICERRKTNKNKLFVELTFAIAKCLKDKKYSTGIIKDLQNIVPIQVIADYIINNDMIDVIHNLEIAPLTNEVALKLCEMNRYELIVKNYKLFNDEILVNSFNELVIQNLLGNIKTHKHLIEEAFQKISGVKNDNVRRSYVLRQFLVFKNSKSISDLNESLNTDYMLIESTDVYERIAFCAAKTVRNNNGHLAKELNGFMSSTGLAKDLIDRINSELIGYL